MDKSKVSNIEFDGIDHNDYPDYCDVYITNAEYDGREITEEELQELNEDTEFIYEKLIEQIF